MQKCLAEASLSVELLAICDSARQHQTGRLPRVATIYRIKTSSCPDVVLNTTCTSAEGCPANQIYCIRTPRRPLWYLISAYFSTLKRP